MIIYFFILSVKSLTKMAAGRSFDLGMIWGSVTHMHVCVLLYSCYVAREVACTKEQRVKLVSRDNWKMLKLRSPSTTADVVGPQWWWENPEEQLRLCQGAQNMIRLPSFNWSERWTNEMHATTNPKAFLCYVFVVEIFTNVWIEEEKCSHIPGHKNYTKINGYYMFFCSTLSVLPSHKNFNQ